MTARKNAHVTDDEIVTAYSERLSAYKVADALGVSAKYVYRVLARRGVHTVGLLEYRKNAERYPRDVQWRIKCDYEDGKSVHQLVDEYGGSIYSVLQSLRRMGGKTRPPQGKRPKPISDEQIAKACEMYRSGMTQEAVGAALGYSQGVISRVLIDANVVMRRRAATNERHGNWKGGRAISGDGYVLVRSNPIDQIERRRRNGMVLEHRLVMARHLGRPLRRNETVHHINGNRTDNRIENLQLRHGRHGNGHALVCLDCGSFNIGHAPIATNKGT